MLRSISRPLVATALLAALQAQAACPQGSTFNTTLGFCADANNAWGPFTQAMVNRCVQYGGGPACTTPVSATVTASGQTATISVARWSVAFTKSLRGTGTCPLGSTTDSRTPGHCTETVNGVSNVHGPFDDTMVDKCLAAEGGPACFTTRWNTSFYQWLLTQPAPFKWTPADDLNAKLPAAIRVMRGADSTLKAVAATLDPRVDAQARWDVVSATPMATPLEVAQRDPQHRVVVNGGYYDATTGQSMSLIVRDGQVLARGITQLTRNGRAYHPTRGMFAETPDGERLAAWGYPIPGAAPPQPVVWAYDRPNPIDVNTTPPPEPNAQHPSIARSLAPRVALGGGPVLVRAGAAVNTAAAELFDSASGVAPDSRAPRTAIARLKDGRVLLLVVDGRSTESRGATLAELATMLVKLGAEEAVNLDGGGSSTMVVDGQVINRPSDGTLRRMPSMVVLRASP